MFTAFNVTELYRKVRKLTEGQNFSQGTILRFMIEILPLLSLITQRGVTETLTSTLGDLKLGLEGVTNFGESPNFLDMACLAKTQKSQFFGHGLNKIILENDGVQKVRSF